MHAFQLLRISEMRFQALRSYLKKKQKIQYSLKAKYHIITTRHQYIMLPFLFHFYYYYFHNSGMTLPFKENESLHRCPCIELQFFDNPFQSFVVR